MAKNFLSAGAASNVNKNAWRQTLLHLGRAPHLAESHPCKVLRKALVAYVVLGLRTSGVEQGFQKSQLAFGSRKYRALPETEACYLKVVLDLPSRDPGKILEGARRLWNECYAAARCFADSARRFDMGVPIGKRKRAGDNLDGQTVLSEASFLKKRRLAAREASATASGHSIDPATLIDNLAKSPSPNCWSLSHTKELKFSLDKLRRRKVEAAAENTLLEGDTAEPLTQLRAEAAGIKATMEKGLRARERREHRNAEALQGVTPVKLKAAISRRPGPG